MINNIMLEKIINKKLNSYQYHDYLPNGLQIEGCQKITKIFTGVTACQKLIEQGIKHKVDAIIVHHGYFWNNEKRVITGILKNRIKLILENNINLYCWHLPLDIHCKLGNNYQIGKLLNIKIKGYIEPLLPWGIFKCKLTKSELYNLIKKKFNRTPFYYGKSPSNNIYKIAWCSGKGQKFVNSAAQFGVDTFLSGEVSEETIHSVIENKLHFFSIGHHASERGGIKSLTMWLKNEIQLDATFIDVNNPI